MREDPFRGDIKRLKGQPNSWRRRVGNYRIIYDLYFVPRGAFGDSPADFYDPLKPEIFVGMG